MLMYNGEWWSLVRHAGDGRRFIAVPDRRPKLSRRMRITFQN